MANYLSTNIVPAWNDSAWAIISGGATITSEKITLPVNSIVRLTLIKGDALIGSSFMKFKVSFKGIFDVMDEYIPLCSLNVRINYLDNTKQNSIIMFNKYSLVDGVYTDETELSVDSKNINTIEIYFNNSSSALGTLEIPLFEIYKSEDINSGQVAQAVSEVVALSKLTSYDNGCIVSWKGDIKDLKLEFITGVSDEFLGILVDGVDFIQYSKVAGVLP